MVVVALNAAMVVAAHYLGMSLWVLDSTLCQVLTLGVPAAPVMGLIGCLAMAVNLVRVMLLMR